MGEPEVNRTRDVLPVETRVGEFRIRGLLGEGAMGEVYLAQDLTLGRRVALKLIKRSMMRGDGLERFLDEARTTASFSHPHIVTLHAVGEFDGRPFLALEYVDGESLRARLAAGPLPVREALRILRAIAEALAEAHRRGLVHADLKPENVVIPKDGRVRIVDFGLARLVGTTSDSASGTPAYMAPERWRGEPPRGAIDVWSCGILLHELITGARPIADQALLTLAYAAPGAPAPYTAHGAAWSGLVADCLALDASARPTAELLVRRLSNLLDPRSAIDDAVRCPFPGLAAFSRDDAAAYFGRAGELDAIVENLRVHPLVPIVGPSGAGKSSFVYAAVIPRLEESGPWSVYALRPGAEPFLRLAAALGDGPPEERAAALRDRPETLSLVLGGLAERSRGRVLVFLDQFEETFTLAGPEAIAFCECVALAALVDEPWRIVLTVRDDFFGRLAESPAMRMLLGAVMRLAPLSTADLRAAVLGPLASSGYTPDTPELVDRIVGDVQHQPACLPLLQFTCQSLWDRRDPSAHQIRTADYDAIGGASGALAVHAEQLMAQMSPTQVRIVRKLLLALVNPDGTRRPRLRSELLAGLPDEAAEVVDRLLERRLLVAGRESELDEARLEVAHESLATAWPQLARWLDETYEERLLLVELEQAALLWSRRGREVDETWVGPALAEAIRKVSDWNITLPDSARMFLEAGQERQRRERRRRRWLAGATVSLLGAAAITAILVAFAFAHKQTEIDLAGADMGAFDLELEPFNWDPINQVPVTPATHPQLSAQILAVSAKDASLPGESYEGLFMQRGRVHWTSTSRVEHVEARSGPAFLKISRGSECASSWIYLRRLPGYSERGTVQTIHLWVPTCQASDADTIVIPAGRYLANDGQGQGARSDRVAVLPTFSIDRTEVTRAAFRMYGQMETFTGDAAAPAGPSGRKVVIEGRLPVVAVNFFTAEAYCRYLGKQLPTVEEWQKAFRGGEVINGALNPMPDRMTPWIKTAAARPANLARDTDDDAVAAVGSYSDDTSPYGVVDMAGNVSEWTLSIATAPEFRGLRIVLGANWGTPAELGHHKISWRNTRPDRYLDFGLGVRCVTHQTE